MDMKSLASSFDRLTVTVFDRLRDPTLLFVRVVWGWLFFETGKGKLGNLTVPTEYFASLGIPLAGVNAVVVGVLECVGGLLLLGGLASRFIAMLLFGNMVVAYLTAHRGSFESIRAFSEAAPCAFLFASLLVLAFGPGRVSIDAWIRRRSGKPVAAGDPPQQRA
jgi:putative oxidoreductase